MNEPRTVDGVIPFASPRLLWRMKEKTHREKVAPDLLFLRQHYGDEIFAPDRRVLPAGKLAVYKTPPGVPNSASHVP